MFNVQEEPPLRLSVDGEDTLETGKLTNYTVNCNMNVLLYNYMDGLGCNILFSNVYDPLIGDDLRDGYYNGGLEAIESFNDGRVVIVPEYRGRGYESVYWGYIDGYKDQGVRVVLDVEESNIPDIVYTGSTGLESCNMIDGSIECNMRLLYEYPYLDQLVFSVSCNPSVELDGRKPFDISLEDDSNLKVVADVRDMFYTVSVRAYDNSFGCNNDSFSVVIHEEPPLTVINSVIDLELESWSYVIGSDNEWVKESIVSNVNLLFNKEFSSSNIYIGEVSSNGLDVLVGRKKGIEAYDAEIDGSNIVFHGDFRDDTYTIDVGCYLENYDGQIETVRFQITESNVPEIVMRDDVDYEICNLYMELLNIDLNKYVVYPFVEDLTFNQGVIVNNGIWTVDIYDEVETRVLTVSDGTISETRTYYFSNIDIIDYQIDQPEVWYSMVGVGDCNLDDVMEENLIP